jgi:anaerobic ribonucleoside-triphosphate reductase
LLQSTSRISAEVFDAASAPVRMQILKLLSSKGPFAYTEIMSSIKLDPIRDAGKFVYHLKSIVEAGLVDMDKETKKYVITELGKMVVSFSRDVEEYVAVKKGKLLVRTSRFSIEEFDRDKITDSLVREAGVPHELAQELAAEVEERLLKFKTKYLTAPLIRELINSILVEKKLEDYRHKLTRLGMPVYDVTQLMNDSSDQLLDVNSVKELAGSSVLEEYVLLNGVPRNVADAHLSGELHLGFLDDWVLKPEEIQHDIRFFFKKGPALSNPPTDFQSGLATLERVCNLCSAEVSNEQSFDMFNIFLAPLVKDLKKDKLSEILSFFFEGLNRWLVSNVSRLPVSLGIELTVPSFLEKVDAIGIDGKVAGTYRDFAAEARLLAEAIVEAIARVSLHTPMLNPRFIFKIRGGILDDPSLEPLMSNIHDLAGVYGLPNLVIIEDSGKVACTSTGLRLNDDWKGDWQTDCFRTGNLGTIFLNLPRIAYEARRDDDTMLEMLSEIMKTTVDAFKSKRAGVGERMKQGLLPVLSNAFDGSSYFYQSNGSYAISYVGLNEAVRHHTEDELCKDDGAMKFGLEAVSKMAQEAKTISEELEMRLQIAQRPGDDAASRLAELDLEKYGRAMTIVEGTRTHPCYTDLTTLPLSTKISLRDRARIESKFQTATLGGHLLPVHLAPKEHDSRTMYKITTELLSEKIQSFAYANNFSYCRSCRNRVVGIISKCPKCESTLITHLGRCSATYEPFALWPEAKRKTVEKRVCYPS